GTKQFGITGLQERQDLQVFLWIASFLAMTNARSPRLLFPSSPCKHNVNYMSTLRKRYANNMQIIFCFLLSAFCFLPCSLVP
ncbi:MAG: hypothetical protein LBD53_08965, partial [Tannerella sp.]|nr:hypothetical protein [Tannerella sp.]